ncbi:hypothetical protein [Candidatus Berkiella aquae]|uniref:Uncharacterized protein n=1 Tax=Candidatus Berkiella aquae TaxID=295108 RepID=A0A0Q9YP64_9GAMM|nr:hypothetical protein [Candidatus Berkiella aquae]MCS5709846.1 hypothetical protein [Candidatus Berkiella aquae]
MRNLNKNEIHQVSGANTTVLKLTAVEMDILVTHSTRFVGSGTYGGHRLNMIIYANEIHDLNDQLLPFNLSEPVYYNGHKIMANAIDGGHIYKILFNQG